MMQVEALLAELAVVEEEINWLEKRTSKLKMSLCIEKQLNNKREMKHPQEQHHKRLPSSKLQNRAEPNDSEWLSGTLSHNRRKTLEEGRVLLSSPSDLKTCLSSMSKGNTYPIYIDSPIMIGGACLHASKIFESF